MTPKEALEKIKALFAEQPAPQPAPAPEKMATDYPTKDGSAVLSIDTLAVGGVVAISGQPAPDGDYVLEDGTTLTVASGVITVITPAAAEGDPEADAMKEIPAKMAAMEQRFSAHEQAFAQVKMDFAAAQEKIGKQQEAITGLLSVVEQLAALPKEEAAVKPAGFREQKDKGAVYDALAENLKKLKTQE